MLSFDKYLQFRLRDDTNIRLYNGKRDYRNRSFFTDKEIEAVEYLCLSLPEEPYKISVGGLGQMCLIYKTLPLNNVLRASIISIYKNSDKEFFIGWEISEHGEAYFYPDKNKPKDTKLTSLFDVFDQIKLRWKNIDFSKIIKKTQT